MVIMTKITTLDGVETINMMYCANFEKVGDTKIEFISTNGMKYTCTFEDKDKRDKTYDDLVDEFVKVIDN